MFDCKEKLEETQRECIKKAMPIISLRRDVDNLYLCVEKLSKEKSPSRTKQINSEIENAEKRIKEKEKEISQIKNFISIIRPIYNKHVSIYEETDGDLYLTELIIRGYIPEKWLDCENGIPKAFNFTIESLKSIIRIVNMISAK